MPELPEVETMRRGVLGIVGGTITDAEKIRCRKKTIAFAPPPAAFRRRVVGRKVTDVDRIGKRVVLRLESGDSIVLEPRMTGLVLVSDPPSREHLRFRLTFANSEHAELYYWDRRGLGSVRIFNPMQWEQNFNVDRLGPDAMIISADQLRNSLHRSRREIKVALLDQRVVAGIGNLYAAELLHEAGVHPAKRCDRMSRRQWRDVHSAMQHILNEAIRYEGSTLGDGTYRNTLNNPGSYQNHHRVYARAGQVCTTCGEAIVQRFVQAQRATFFCASCQRK